MNGFSLGVTTHYSMAKLAGQFWMKFVQQGR